LNRKKPEGQKKYGVVGIGHAIVDVLADVEDEFLAAHKLEKGMMKLIDEADVEALHDRIKSAARESGGSVANTIAGLASLGDRVAFMGKVKDDHLGNIFEKGLNDLGVVYCTKKADEGSATACCVVLTTPDAQRTMNTCLGISGTMGPEDIDEEVITESRVLYLEGYLWDTDMAKKAFLKAMETASASRGEVALSLSDPFCVERHREEFLELLEKNTDILFANEEEIKMLFEVAQFEEALKRCRSYNTIFALTRGGDGSVILKGSSIHEIEAKKDVKVKDTTGAGDMYAAGFLHGYINGRSLDICGRMGNLTAAAVLSHFGGRPKVSILEILKQSGLEK
jgi:sugar/nucleoside kinase (ribokinase family)